MLMAAMSALKKVGFQVHLTVGDEITLVGMYADTSPACVSMMGRAVMEPAPQTVVHLAARSRRREWR